MLFFLVLAAGCSPSALAQCDVGVMNFRGPLKVDIDTNLWYKIKAGRISDPDPGDFAYLGNVIAKQVLSDLKSSLGERAVHISSREADDDGDDAKSSATRARYILKGTIDSVRFEGNIVLGPWYSLNVSSRLVSSQSGRTVWRMSNRQFQKIYKTVKGEEISDVFAEVIVPKVVAYISPRVKQAIDSEK